MPTIDDFFTTAKKELALDPAATYEDVLTFGSTSAQADTITALILSGHKTITASSFELLAKEQAPLPQAGAFSILVNGKHQPTAVLYIEDVRIQPFLAVDEQVARQAGATSLTAWRSAHKETFSRQYAKVGLTFDSNEAHVVLRIFRVLFPQ